MFTKRRKAIALVVILLVIAVVVAYRLQANRLGNSITVKWEGWRYARVVLKEQDYYIADTNLLAKRFRMIQLGPVRIVRGLDEP